MATTNPPPPPYRPEKMISKQLLLPPATKAWLDKEAARLKKPASEIARDILEEAKAKSEEGRKDGTPYRAKTK